jgi:hypothetical protein
MKTRVITFILFSIAFTTFSVSLAQTTDEFNKIEKESKDAAIELYPDSGVKGTSLYNAISAEVLRLEKENPTYFNDPRWPLRLAIAASNKLSKEKISNQSPQSPVQAEATPQTSQGLVQPTYVSAKLDIDKPDIIESPECCSDWRVEQGEVYVVFGEDNKTMNLWTNDPALRYRNLILKCGPVRVSVPKESLSFIPPSHSDYQKADMIYKKELKEILATIEQDEAQQQQDSKEDRDAAYKAALIREMQKPKTVIIQNQ